MPSTRPLLLAPLAAIALLLSACATTGSGSGDTGRDVLTRGDLAPFQGESAYEAVLRLRRDWFNTRLGGTNPIELSAAGDAPAGTAARIAQSELAVFVDRIPQEGGVEALRLLVARDIERMQRLSATEATMQFGQGYAGGAILVTTRAR